MLDAVAERTVIATRGGDFIVAISGLPDPVRTMVVVVETRHGRCALRGGALPLQSILARGYCEEWHGTPKQARAILAAIPRRVPIAVPLPAGV